jgi:hypothetical protein
MPQITQGYLEQLAPIYKDVLAAFWRFDPTRKNGEGLAFQSLYSVLDEQYTLGEIRAACLELEKGGAVEIRNGIFAHPTELGEELITAVTGKAPITVPPFVPPTGE